MATNPELSRNDFVKVTVGVLGGIMGATIAIPAVAYVLSPAVHSLGSSSTETWIPAGPLENYPVGTPTLFSFTRSKVNGWEKTTTSHGVFIYRATETETQAFSNVCTHLACRVNWFEADQLYRCPCHDAAFTIDGQVASGPPPRPMDEYATKVEEGVLYINFVEG
jgi:menaquinol-cytochrome c reductase iron-sulfur subunit